MNYLKGQIGFYAVKMWFMYKLWFIPFPDFLNKWQVIGWKRWVKNNYPNFIWH